MPTTEQGLKNIFTVTIILMGQEPTFLGTVSFYPAECDLMQHNCIYI